jgi:hypothetical protein
MGSKNRDDDCDHNNDSSNGKQQAIIAMEVKPWTSWQRVVSRRERAGHRRQLKSVECSFARRFGIATAIASTGRTIRRMTYLGWVLASSQEQVEACARDMRAMARRRKGRERRWPEAETEAERSVKWRRWR